MSHASQGSYASIQAIRESAGLLSRVQNETPKGAVDGANKVFTVVRRPIVDGNYDDVVGTEDVRFFVNGAPVDVQIVDAKGGAVTLVTAPAAGTKVTIDYQFSAISDEYTATKQQEADSWVNLKLRSAGVPLPLPNPLPSTITTIAEMYAAGLILTRDWGNRVDTEQTSKDGYAKLRTARDLLADYILGFENDKKSRDKRGGGDSITVRTDGNVFERNPFGYDGTTEEDFFMRRGS